MAKLAKVAWFCLGAALGACTYDVTVEHAAKDLNLDLVYAPCGTSDSGSDASHD